MAYIRSVSASRRARVSACSRHGLQVRVLDGPPNDSDSLAIPAASVFVARAFSKGTHGSGVASTIGVNSPNPNSEYVRAVRLYVLIICELRRPVLGSSIPLDGGLNKRDPVLDWSKHAGPHCSARCCALHHRV